MKDVLGNHLEGPEYVPFGSLVEYHPMTAKDLSRIHQFGKESFTWIVPSDTLCTRGDFGRGDVLVRRTFEGLETMDASEICSKRTQCEGGDISKRRRIFSNRRWTNQNHFV